MSCPGAGTGSTGVELAMSWKISCTQYVYVCASVCVCVWEAALTDNNKICAADRWQGCCCCCCPDI